MRYADERFGDAEAKAYRDRVVASVERRAGGRSPAGDFRKVMALRFDVEASIQRGRLGATMASDLRSINSVLSGRSQRPAARREADPYVRLRGETYADYSDRLYWAGLQPNESPDE